MNRSSRLDKVHGILLRNEFHGPGRGEQPRMNGRNRWSRCYGVVLAMKEFFNFDALCSIMPIQIVVLS
jgi:hypothetical protein